MGWRKVASMPGGQRSPERCRGELAGGVGGTHGGLDTLAAGCCRCVGNGRRIATRRASPRSCINPKRSIPSCRQVLRSGDASQPRDGHQHGHGIADRPCSSVHRRVRSEAVTNVGGSCPHLPFVWRPRAIALAGALKGRRRRRRPQGLRPREERRTTRGLIGRPGRR